MNIEVGDEVRCIYTMRQSKEYFRFGTPARDGDSGKVFRITELKDVTIVEFQTGWSSVHCHIQNLIK